MANELVIKEYSAAGHSEHGLSVSVYQEANLLTTQFVNIGSESSAFDSDTIFVSITAKVALQFRIGTLGDAGAVVNTAGTSYMSAGMVLDFKVGALTAVDTVADA